MSNNIIYLVLTGGLGALIFFLLGRRKTKENLKEEHQIRFEDIKVTPSPKNEEKLKETQSLIESAENENKKAKDLLRRMKEKYGSNSETTKK